MKRRWIYSFLFFAPVLAFGQAEINREPTTVHASPCSFIHSIGDTIACSIHQKPKFFVDLSTYNSALSRQPAVFTDLLLGISYNNKIYFGAGISGLNSDVVTSRQVTDNSGTYQTNTRMNMTLFMCSADYVFFRNYPWTASIAPFKAGVGNVEYQYINRMNRSLTTYDKNFVVTYQPQATLTYNFLKWIGVGASLGYRKTLYSTDHIHGNLDSFTYSIGVQLFIGAIYDAVFPNGICPKKPQKGT